MNHPDVYLPQAPFHLVWNVTNACNLRCEHCFAASDKPLPGELSTAEAVDLIDQMAEMGVFDLAFCGGEPFIRRDIFDLLGHAYGRGLTIGIGSNGWLINDGLAQTLAYLHLQVDRALSEPYSPAETHVLLVRVPDTLERANADLRAMILTLRGIPDDASRERGATVRDALTKVAGCQQAVRVRADGSYRVPGATADQVQWVVREAVGNALRHARAHRVEVALRRDGPDLVVSVADDGPGLCPDSAATDRPERLGLTTMCQRAAGLGGQLTVCSGAGRGTTVELRWPDPTR